jgi:hypothetical protein
MARESWPALYVRPSMARARVPTSKSCSDVLRPAVREACSMAAAVSPAMTVRYATAKGSRSTGGVASISSCPDSSSSATVSRMARSHSGSSSVPSSGRDENAMRRRPGSVATSPRYGRAGGSHQ